jgi:hypothetical protein
MADAEVVTKEEQDRRSEVALWHDRINTSRKWRDDIKERNGWERFISEYKGEYKVVLGNLQVPPINEVFAYTQSLITFLFARNPYISVNPKKTGTILGAKILEAAVNYFWRELKIKEEVQREIIDAILVGHGWHKTGMDVQFDGKVIHSDKMFSNRISWKDVFFNIGAMNPPYDCRWVAHRIYMPVDDMKKKFGTVAANVNGVSLPATSQDTYNSAKFKDDLRYGCIYEIFDAKSRMIYLISDEVPFQYLQDPKPWPEYLETVPFSMIQFNPINDEAYGLSDIAPWEAQILEKIKVFTMSLNHVKRFNRQLPIKKGTMSPESMDKFEKGIDGSILEVTGNYEQLRPLDFGALPPDIYIILDRLDAIKRNVNGLPETFQGGQFKTQTRTLGELEAVQGGAMGRIQRKIDVVETHSENIARQILANLMNQFPLETAVKITGQEPQEVIAAFQDAGIFDPVSQTISFKSDDIKGEYDVAVKAGSTLPLDKGTRDQILDRLIELAIPLAQANSIPPFLEELIKERLKAYDILSLEEAFKMQQEALAKSEDEQLQLESIQAQKTLAETAKRHAQAELIQTDTDLKRATGMAKATGMIPMDVKV